MPSTPPPHPTPGTAARRLFVTGASGFVGGWVTRLARHHPQWQVHAAPHELDLLDQDGLRAHLQSVQPDAVIHLAAQSSVALSLQDPVGTCRVNVLGTQSLLHALDATGFTGRLLYVSSGDVYGSVATENLPVRESLEPQPRSPYASSKVAAEVLCLQWARIRPASVVVARPFNHIGPGQDRRFAVADFAAQIAALRAASGAQTLVCGDVDVTRDFLDVRDVVQAYFALLERGASAATYNICSGTERSLRSLILQMGQLAGVELQLQPDAQRIRPGEQRRMLGDASRLRHDTGWAPSLSIEQTLTDLLSPAVAGH